MGLEFKRLTEVSKADIVELMNNSLVRKQMPLTSDNFNETDWDEFISAKEQLWSEHGYGPWAFVADGKFAGWGGSQPEEGDADLGIVLHPKYWGWGKAIYAKIIEFGFNKMNFKSITILFPPSRRRIKGIYLLGFKSDGEMDISGECFNRYRLYHP